MKERRRAEIAFRRELVDQLFKREVLIVECTEYDSSAIGQGLSDSGSRREIQAQHQRINERADQISVSIIERPATGVPTTTSSCPL